MTFKTIIKSSLCIALFLMGNPCKAQSNDVPPEDSTVYSYESINWIKLDSALQIAYQDTLKAVEQKLNGLWQYQGIKQENKTIADTLYLSEEGTYFVKEGKVSLPKDNGKEEETDDIIVSLFDFKNDMHERYMLVNKEGKRKTDWVRSWQSIYQIAYYKNEMGLYIRSKGGNYFKPIKYLDNKLLILERDKEYGSHNITNGYVTVKIKQELEYYIRKD